MPTALYQLTADDFAAYYGRWCREGGPPKPLPSPHPWTVQVPRSSSSGSSPPQQPLRQQPRRRSSAVQQQQQHAPPTLHVNLFALYQAAVELHSSSHDTATPPADVWARVAAKGVGGCVPPRALTGEQLSTVCSLYLLPFMAWLDELVHDWQAGNSTTTAPGQHQQQHQRRNEQQQQEQHLGLLSAARQQLVRLQQQQQQQCVQEGSSGAANTSPARRRQHSPERRQRQRRQRQAAAPEQPQPQLQLPVLVDLQLTPPHLLQQQQQPASSARLTWPHLPAHLAPGSSTGASDQSAAAAAVMQHAGQQQQQEQPGTPVAATAAAVQSGGPASRRGVHRALLGAGPGSAEQRALLLLRQPASAAAAAASDSDDGSAAVPAAFSAQLQRPRRAAAVAANAAICSTPPGSPMPPRSISKTAAAARDVASPIPDDPLASVLLWLRGASLELADGDEKQQAAVAAHTRALAAKYRPLASRLRAALAVELPPEEEAELAAIAGLSSSRRLQHRAGADGAGGGGARRSGRDRKQTDFYSPGGRRLAEYVNPYAIKIGREHQATIPAAPAAPRGAKGARGGRGGAGAQQASSARRQPDARESKYLSAPLYDPAAASGAGGSAGAGGSGASLGQWLSSPLAALGLAGSSSAGAGRPNPALAQLGPGVFRHQYEVTPSGAARRALLEEWLAKSDAALGPQLAEALGMARLGARLAPTWPEPQQLLFAIGMLDTKFRNFPYRGLSDKIDLRSIQRRWLPGKPLTALNSYYYNVFKNLGSDVAQQFEDAIAAPTRAFCAAPEARPPPGLAEAAPLFRRQVLARLQATWDEAAMGPLPAAAAAGIAALSRPAGSSGSKQARGRPANSSKLLQQQQAQALARGWSPLLTETAGSSQPSSRSVSPCPPPRLLASGMQVATAAGGAGVQQAAPQRAQSRLAPTSATAAKRPAQTQQQPAPASSSDAGVPSFPHHTGDMADEEQEEEGGGGFKRRRLAQPSDVAAAAASAAAAALQRVAAFAIVGPAAVSGRVGAWLGSRPAALQQAAGEPPLQVQAQQQDAAAQAAADAAELRKRHKLLHHLARHPSKGRGLTEEQLRQLQLLTAAARYQRQLQQQQLLGGGGGGGGAGPQGPQQPQAPSAAPAQQQQQVSSSSTLPAASCGQQQLQVGYNRRRRRHL